MLDRLLELEERDGADLWIIKTKNLIVGKDNAKLVLKQLQQAIDISESLKIEMKNGKISKQPLKEIIEKAERYDIIKNGYKEFNDKHFLELCEAFLGE